MTVAACAAPGAPAEAPGFAGHLRHGEFRAADGTRLPLRIHAAEGPPRAILLALHGLNDHAGFIDEAARHFAASGIRTVAYDQRGFGAADDRGRWGGAAAMADDFWRIVGELRTRHAGTPLYVFGESMGAAVIAVALAGRPDPGVDGVILAAPAVWSRRAMPWYQRLGLWLGATLTPSASISGRRFGYLPTDHEAARRALAADPLVIQATRFSTLDGVSDLMDLAADAVPRLGPRALLLYGAHDVMMPRRALRGLFERWPAGTGENFRFAWYAEGHHMLLRDRQRRVVWDDILSWIVSPGQTLPSGHERDRGQMAAALGAE